MIKLISMRVNGTVVQVSLLFLLTEQYWAIIYMNNLFFILTGYEQDIQHYSVKVFS